MMNFLSRLFLESAWQLGVFSFLLFAAVLLIRSRLESQALRRRLLPFTFLLIAVLFIIQTIVVTERERILDRLDLFVQAIETPSPGALAAIIAANYESEGMDRAAFLDALDRWLAHIDVYDTRYRRRDVDIHGDTAQMTLGAGATVHRDGGAGEMHVGRWRIDWVREQDEWRIRAIRVELIDAMPIEQMRPYLP
jgi:SnoaL-like domain